MKYYAATADQPKLVLYSPQRSPGQYPLRAPLPLIAVSALVQKKCSVCIVDNNLYQRPVEKVLEECRDAVCLGITALTSYQITDGLEVAKLVRAKYPKLPIVWGGWHPTLEPEGTIKSAYVDIVVRKRGERTLDELVDCLMQGKELDTILGISYKRDEKVFHIPDRPLEDINAFPSMPYNLIDVNKVLYQNWYGSRVISYVSSYGCPWGCGFCADQTAHNRRWSGLRPLRIVEEIEKLNKDYGVDAIVFEDSNFFVNEERARQFCEELIKRGLGIRYGNVNGHIRQLLKFEEEMWDLLVRSGCTSMLIGAESGYQPALDLMNKGLRVEEIIKLAEKCRDKKIKLSVSVLWGLPWDPDYEKTRRLVDTEIRHTIDLLDKVHSINPRNKLLCAIYTPYPGSPLYSRSLGLGLEPPQTLDGWANWVLQERNTPWVTRQQESRVKMLHPYIFPFIDPDSYPLAMGLFHNRFVRLVAKITYRMFRSIARLRWKFKFFALPIDYYLFKLYGWIASKLKLPNAA